MSNLPLKIQFLLLDFVYYILRLKLIKEIILFGSYAENDPTFRSDVDLAVKFNKIGVSKATEFRINILGSVSDKVDVQIYNVLPEKIKREIDKYGKVIYKSKE